MRARIHVLGDGLAGDAYRAGALHVRNDVGRGDREIDRALIETGVLSELGGLANPIDGVEWLAPKNLCRGAQRIRNIGRIRGKNRRNAHLGSIACPPDFTNVRAGARRRVDTVEA